MQIGRCRHLPVYKKNIYKNINVIKYSEILLLYGEYNNKYLTFRWNA